MINKTEQDIRDALGDFLGILEYKARSGALTIEDARAMLEALSAGGGVRATISELAGYYNTTEVNVRSVIKRRVFAKPSRKVYYDFQKFREAVPKSWHRHISKSGD